MARTLQRLSQLITTFGPGAMIDLPTRSVLVGGLERWDMRDAAFKPINERRLAELLEKRLKETGRLDEAAILPVRSAAGLSAGRTCCRTAAGASTSLRAGSG